jgi:hypothetical protein
MLYLAGPAVLLAPVLPLLEVEPARFHSTAAHQTSLTSVRRRQRYCFATSTASSVRLRAVLRRRGSLDQRRPALRDTSEIWLAAGALARSLTLAGAQRNVAKLFSLSARLPRFVGVS